MTARLKRLRRLHSVREIERQAVVRDVAQAEAARSELEALAARTLRLAGDYADGSGSDDGATLTQRVRFGGALQQIYAATCSNATRARELADSRIVALAEAGRRRDAVRDGVAAETRRITAARRSPAAHARRAGTIRDEHEA